MSTISYTTANQLIDRASDGFRYDLLRGELIQMSPAGREHGKIASNFHRVLSNYVVDHDLGETYAAETGFLLSRNPDTVLAPDVSFIAADRLPEIEDVTGFIPIAPDLAVEVVSPSDRYSGIEDKVAAWLNAGTKIVIILDPRRAVARIYRGADDLQTLTVSDTLELPEILSGLSISLRDVFK